MRRRSLILSILFAFFVFHGPQEVLAQSRDVSQKQQERDRLVSSIAQLESLIQSDNAKQKNVQRELALTGEKIRLQQRLLGEIDNDIYKINIQIKASRKGISALQSRLDSLEAVYHRLVLAAYKNRDTNLWYEFILSSESISQAFRRYSYFRNISAAIKKQAVEVRIAQEEFSAAKSKLDNQLQDYSKARSVRQKEYNNLQKDKRKYSQTMDTVKKNIQTNRKKMAAQSQKLKKLNAEIDKMLRDDVAKQTYTKVDPQLVALNKKFSDNAGKLPWPMDGYIIGNFHEAFDAYDHKVKREPRNGILVAGRQGASVYAVFDGEVTMFGRLSNGSYGVVIRHGSYRTFYCGLESVSVAKGQKVVTGQQIGVVRTVDSKSDLEFIIYFNNTYINPMKFLRK